MRGQLDPRPANLAADNGDLAHQFFSRLAEEPPPRPAPAAEQWLVIQRRLDEDRRRRALLPLRWTRNLVLLAAPLAAYFLWPQGTTLQQLFSPLSFDWSSPLDLLLSTRVVLILALAVMAAVFWLEGEKWIES